MAGLATFRAKASAAMLETKPAVVDANGFLGWLRKNVKRYEVTRGLGGNDKKADKKTDNASWAKSCGQIQLAMVK